MSCEPCSPTSCCSLQPPPPTCGCDQTVLTGEICLNTTYYYYGNDPYLGNIYYAFDFNHVIFVPASGLPPLNTAIQEFMLVFFGTFCTDYNMSFTASTTLPSGYTLAQSSSASNCFLYEAAIYGIATPGVTLPIPFLSYAAYNAINGEAAPVGCTSVVPTILPCSSN